MKERYSIVLVLILTLLVFQLQGCAVIAIGVATTAAVSDEKDCERKDDERTTLSKVSCAGAQVKEGVVKGVKEIMGSSEEHGDREE